MVGSLLEVGCGRRQPNEIRAMAQDVQGHPQMVKAPPQGLFLVNVQYN
jgi:tRNA U38,U39,U40 pseudouridine synthase TruA